MRVIVTGGAGFVGTLLARRLLAGPVEVGGHSVGEAVRVLQQRVEIDRD